MLQAHHKILILLQIIMQHKMIKNSFMIKALKIQMKK